MAVAREFPIFSPPPKCQCQPHTKVGRIPIMILCSFKSKKPAPKSSLAAAIKELDEAREYCKKMLLEKMTVLQSAPNSVISCTAKGIDGLSSSDGEQSIASSQ
ncbi:hypothetical protein SASPL_104820 [Salvia splendens]|uniref:Uncharacterized protein n=1 Tax=Salvia splendens TaxID=180675 RepID=A0A8X9A8S5_SALSN|nr:hypothetical protein SASPL_104820 [Salvia splendens]